MNNMEITKECLKKLLKEGKTQKEIAELLNLSVSTFSSKLSEKGLRLRDIKTEINTEIVLKLKDEGLTNSEIYEKTGFSLSTIKRYLDNPNCEKVVKNSSKSDSIKSDIEKLVLEGKTNLEIASILNISPTTSRKYTNILGLETNSVKKKPIVKTDLILSQEQLDLIYGSLLGDLNIQINWKNARISIHHGGDQEQYFDHKCEVLNNIIGHINKNPRFDKRLNKYLPCFSSKTLSHSVFTDIYNKVYINGVKTVTEEWLNLVSPRGLAYWFMDDGTNQGSIGTLDFSLEENELLQNWLLDKYGVETTIQKQKGYNKESDNKLIKGTKDFYYHLYLCAKTRKRFDDLIRPYMHESMVYKLIYK